MRPLTTDTNADASRRLHHRLTVALAAASERDRVVTAYRSRSDVVVVGADDVHAAAEDLAAERAGDRTALRARLDAAADLVSSDRDAALAGVEDLRARRLRVLEGAAWAQTADAELATLRSTAAAALSALESRRHDHRSARSALERVMEQRAAAAAAIEQADRELAELVGVGMDETGLRRELEASGHAVREILDRHSEALARIEELEVERVEIERRMAEVQDELAARPVADVAADPATIARVRAALERYEDEAVAGGFDQRAKALADAFTDLGADLDEVIGRAPPRPDAAALRAAEERAERAAADLALLEVAAKAGGLTAADRAELDAAHAAVTAAEEAAQRRIGGGGARRRLEQARLAEQELLARHGFSAYLDVVLGGGRVDAHRPERLEAERVYVRACTERDALRAALDASLGASPELAYLESEQLRLVGHAAEVLDIDARDLEGLVRADRGALIRLLRGQRLVSAARRSDLREALGLAGVVPAPGDPLAACAARWLDAHEHDASPAAPSREPSPEDAEAELSMLERRGEQLADELTAARAREARAASELEQARRSVGAFEAELSARAGEDEQRIHRFAAAEQLRTQVEALAATLTRAEHDAREALDRATEAVGAAEVSYDRAGAALTELGRQARRLVGELPHAQRPEGDVVTVLVELAARLQSHAESLELDIAAAAGALEQAEKARQEAIAAAEAVGTGRDGPRREDLDDAVAALVSTPAALLVLDDPCSHLPDAVQDRFRAELIERTTSGPVLLLSEDPAVLGWAIELPADGAMVLPADSLLNLVPPAADTDEADAPTSPAPRWAGHR